MGLPIRLPSDSWGYAPYSPGMSEALARCECSRGPPPHLPQSSPLLEFHLATALAHDFALDQAGDGIAIEAQQLLQHDVRVLAHVG